MTTYSAITVYQPWATLIAEGCKRFEFRYRPAPVRLVGKRIAIHAGMRKVSVLELRALLVKLHSQRWRETGLEREDAIKVLEAIQPHPEAVPLGAVLCTALLGKPLANADLSAALGLGTEMNDSDRGEHSNWGWPLSEIERVVPPAPQRGSQGWWKWTEGMTP